MRRIWTKEELETVFRINEAGELERFAASLPKIYYPDKTKPKL